MLDANERVLSRDWHVHLVGIGGAGMGGIAEVLVNLGCRVSGSDLGANAMTAHLESLGVGISIGHAAVAVGQADVLVVSSAVPPDNPEVAEARSRRIPVIPRAEMLAELMRFRRGIAVAGTHGKTTTTSMIASVLADGGLDPTFVIGGQLNSAGSHARLGAGEYLVAEADESDGSFLLLQPRIGVVTNIDRDHLVNYDDDFERVCEAFGAFIKRLPFYGVAVLCVDDPHVRALLPNVTKPYVTYGVAEDADFRAHEVTHSGLSSEFSIAHADDAHWLRARIHLPGRHNVLNALAAVAVAHQLEVERGTIVHGLEQFDGIARRFQVHGEIVLAGRRVTLVDDYAHHPTELRAMLDALAEAYRGRRLVAVFQPHRFSRTRDLFEDFVDVLADVPQLVLTEVYAAGEPPDARADGRSLTRAVRQRGRGEPIFLESLESVATTLEHVCRDDDVVVLLGAGSIGALASMLVARFNRQPTLRGIA